MGFIQLNFNARQTRILSTAVLVLIISLLTASLSLPLEGSLISWQAVAVMDGLRLRRGPEQLGHLGIAVLLGLLSEGEVLAVGLRLSGEGFLQVMVGIGHLI